MLSRRLLPTRSTVRSLHSLTSQAWTRDLSRAKQRLTEGDLTVRLIVNSFYPAKHTFSRGQVQQFSDWYQSTTEAPTNQLKALSFGNDELMVAIGERSDRFDYE